MSEEIKDIKLTDEEYTKKLEDAIEDLNNHCDKLQQENRQLKDKVQDLQADYGTQAQIERDMLRQVNQKLKEENKKLKQWDCNKDSRNSRQRVANARLIKQNNLYKSVIDETIDVINQMLTGGYTDEKRLTSYFVVGKNSEFGCRAEVLLEILNKANIKENK